MRDRRSGVSRSEILATGLEHWISLSRREDPDLSRQDVLQALAMVAAFELLELAGDRPLTVDAVQVLAGAVAVAVVEAAIAGRPHAVTDELRRWLEANRAAFEDLAFASDFTPGRA